MRTILAVAVGDPSNDRVLSTNPDLTGIRPYIKGLISWLKSQPDPPNPDNPLPTYTIGTDYKIVYCERAIGNLPSAFQDADLYLCMSTTVAKAAVTYTQAHLPAKPIVAIVSDPFSEGFTDNVCGVSASRDRLARLCFRQFKKKNHNVKNVFVLHRSGYLPSERAKGWLGNKNITLVPVADTDDLQTKVQGIGIAADRGVLVLPADRFFGAANNIVSWTGAMPTFWSTPDFPAGSFGGYGYKQELCGQFMAERVATIWNNQTGGAADPMPDPKWVMIGPEYITVRPTTAVLKKKKSAKSSKSKAKSKSSTRKARSKK